MAKYEVFGTVNVMYNYIPAIELRFENKGNPFDMIREVYVCKHFYPKLFESLKGKTEKEMLAILKEKKVFATTGVERFNPFYYKRTVSRSIMRIGDDGVRNVITPGMLVCDEHGQPRLRELIGVFYLITVDDCGMASFLEDVTPRSIAEITFNEICIDAVEAKEKGLLKWFE